MSLLKKEDIAKISLSQSVCRERERERKKERMPFGRSLERCARARADDMRALCDFPRDTKYVYKWKKKKKKKKFQSRARAHRDKKMRHTVVISPSSSVKYIPVMSPLALSNTSGFSNVKNAVPDVPSLLLVSFTSGTDVSTVSRTKEIVAALVTTNARRETEAEEEDEDLLLETNDCERKVEVVRDARADAVVDIVSICGGKF